MTLRKLKHLEETHTVHAPTSPHKKAFSQLIQTRTFVFCCDRAYHRAIIPPCIVPKSQISAHVLIGVKDDTGKL